MNFDLKAFYVEPHPHLVPQKPHILDQDEKFKTFLTKELLKIQSLPGLFTRDIVF